MKKKELLELLKSYDDDSKIMILVRTTDDYSRIEHAITVADVIVDGKRAMVLYS